MSKIKDLSIFMRESAKTDEIITVPAPDSFKDGDGKPVMLEFKVLSLTEREKIRKNYTKRSIAVDKKGKPIIDNGEIVFKTETDNMKSSMHMLTEALVYPDLKDPELMKYFECFDITEMPMKVFFKPGEFEAVNKAFLATIGIGDDIEAADESVVIEDVKN